MLRENCEIGMEIVFGRPNGEKTLAKITKINDKSAKVVTLEGRGYSNKPAGKIWNVAYSLMQPANQTTPEPQPEKTLSAYDRAVIWGQIESKSKTVKNAASKQDKAAFYTALDNLNEYADKAFAKPS